jgi:hypothetical protein
MISLYPNVTDPSGRDNEENKDTPWLLAGCLKETLLRTELGMKHERYRPFCITVLVNQMSYT